MFRLSSTGYMLLDNEGHSVATLSQEKHGPLLATAGDAIALLKRIRRQLENGEAIELDSDVGVRLDEVIARSEEDPPGYEDSWVTRRRIPSATSRGASRLEATDWQRKLWDRPVRHSSWDGVYGSGTSQPSRKPAARSDEPIDPSALMARSVSKKEPE